MQAKRWEGTVGRPEIQQFAGALQGQRGKKGTFITTSDLTKDAHDYAPMIESRIVLIDGARLCSPMIDHGIGVTRATSYEVKRLDVEITHIQGNIRGVQSLRRRLRSGAVGEGLRIASFNDG